MLKEITLKIKVPAAHSHCTEPSPVKGHPGFRCVYMVEKYWKPDWIPGSSERYCKAFRKNLSLIMNSDGTCNWLKPLECIIACKKADDE